MSEIKVNKITPKQNCTQVTLGDSGDTFVIPSGVTITNNGTQTGFGRTGTVDWDTTAKTAGFTAVSGNGYFVNTTSGAITVTLPASPSAGDIVSLLDYAGTAAINNITIARNGSNINGAASDLTISKNNSGITLVYVDGTQGWKGTQTSNLSDIELQPEYVVATGGTETICGDYKIHTFTGPGTFCVSSLANPLGGPNSVDYLVVAGGGGGGGNRGGGGGAGGYRESSGATSGCYSRSPLGACVSALPVTATAFPITVGGGGTGEPGPTANGAGSQGSSSIFSTITSTGGGGGRDDDSPKPANPSTNGGSGGGSGGGAQPINVGGSGNTPPVSPPQGQDGGSSISSGPAPRGNLGGGGGGATLEGRDTCSPGCRGFGGTGATSSINGTSTARAGGGGAGSAGPAVGACGVDGGGDGGDANAGNPGCNGTANTGGGGGGGSGGNGAGGTGGSGIVIIRYKFQ